MKPNFTEFATEEPVDIPTTEVQSSLIHSWGYSAKTRTLAVVFKSTMDAWDYEDVPAEIAREMKNSKSAGGYFINYIRGKYVEKLVRRGDVKRSGK